jgi:hypothetical protein
MQVCAQYTMNPTRFHHQMCLGPVSTASAAWPICDSQHATLQITLVGKQKSFLFPVKIQGDSYSFDIADSKYDTQTAWSPTNVKGGD